MLKKILLQILTIFAAALLAIPLPTYAQINEFKITPADGEPGDYFGYAVSISGDYAIVGSRRDDVNGSNSGSAYIFKRSDIGWLEEAKLLASDGAVEDAFGHAVSISGDYAIVGARGDDDNGFEAGSAYVYKRTGTSWTQEAKLLASDGASNDDFAWVVSISGDYAIVGSRHDDVNGSNSGSAYIFKRSDIGWLEEAKLLASDGAKDDHFGWSVSISGDYVVVGATNDDDNWGNSGSAYVYKRTGTSWAEEAKLYASDAAAEDYFGWSVSISGDYAVVGAIHDDDNGKSSGSAYVYKRTGTSWAEEAKLLASDGAANDEFGRSISISGDYAIVGAYKDNNANGTDAGSAYIFKRDGTSWIEQSKLTASDGAAYDWFGGFYQAAVSISGDYAIVGAYLDDDNGGDSGSAYVYNGITYTIGIDDDISEVPTSFVLEQNYPNPFNLSTTIRYGLENDNYVTVEIFDISGKLISTLHNNNQTQGWHSVIWNGTNHQGEQVPTGLYISKVTSDNVVKSIKLMLLK